MSTAGPGSCGGPEVSQVTLRLLLVEKELPNHAKDVRVDALIAKIQTHGFRWNTSDGN